MLRGELKYQECYDSILYFVTSMEIRSGLVDLIKKVGGENGFDVEDDEDNDDETED